jgi:hypothetical protein
MVKWFDDLWFKLTGKKAKRKYVRKPETAAKAAATRRAQALKVAEQAQQMKVSVSEPLSRPFPTSENIAKAEQQFGQTKVEAIGYPPLDQTSIVGDFDKAAEKFREVGNGAASWDRN